MGTNAETIAAELDGAKMGDIKKRARAIKRDHDLAMQLWATGAYHARLLATLILDKKLLTQELIDSLTADMQEHETAERGRLSEWFMANQLMKSKKTTALLESWEQSPSPVQRRLFWYHQARLRWTGQTPPPNTEALLEKLERDMATAHPDVQWTMNFCAAWIGVHSPEHRERCVKLGERLGLYKEERAVKGCTPNYLPEFIRIEAAKQE